MKTAPQELHDWNGRPFPKGAERLTLPDGRILEDALIWPDFCQNELKLDPDVLWQELLSFPTQANDKLIPFRDKGDDPHWIHGEHPALGFVLNRDQLWCQCDFAGGLRRYGYSGWQYRISPATHAVEFVPPVQQLAERINKGLVRSGHLPHNHWIAHRYDSQERHGQVSPKEFIGFNSDKDSDFAENSFFIIITLGVARPFAFRRRGDKGSFFGNILSAGTAVFVRCKGPGAANDLVEHGLFPGSKAGGASGSIVSRCIETCIPWDRVRHEVEKRGKLSFGHLTATTKLADGTLIKTRGSWTGGAPMASATKKKAKKAAAADDVQKAKDAKEADAAAAEAAQTKLVDEACEHIQTIIKRTTFKGLAEVGEYVFTTFFQGDMAKVASHDPSKNSSFRRLAARCGTPALPMGKSWLHGAVSLAIRQKELGGKGSWDAISLTHQQRLLPIKDDKKVLLLAGKVIKEDLSTRKLQELVREELKTQPKEPKEGKGGRPATNPILRALSAGKGLRGFKVGDVSALEPKEAKAAAADAKVILGKLEELVKKLEARAKEKPVVE